MAKAGKKWTVMVYLAGDNNLDGAALADLAEMKKVGSTAEVDVVAELDRAGAGIGTKRYHLQKGTPLAKDATEDLGETDTGDPAVLKSFMQWGIQNYPAEKYMVVLWNHGAGWDDTDIYRTARSAMGLGIRRRDQLVAPGSNGGEISMRRVRTVADKPLRRALFRTTIEAAIRPGPEPRAIAFDDTSKDFLDNIETKKVFAAVTKKLGRPIDVLGMDACLMSMAEVAYQLRDHVRVTVGSEEVEPGDGWPYDKILKELAAKPEMTAEELGVVIVQKYLASYDAESNVTQAACDLSKCDRLAGSMDRLAKALTPGFSDPAIRAAIFESRDQVQSYEVEDYIDLYNFCDLLQQKVGTGTVNKAAQDVMAAVRAPGYVLDAGYKGSSMQHSYGVSVYFPRKQISPLYATLDITKEISWKDLLEKYSEEKRQPARGAAPRPRGPRGPRAVAPA